MNRQNPYDPTDEFSSPGRYPSDSSEPTPSREELFLALQKRAEESKDARQRAVEAAKTASLHASP